MRIIIFLLCFLCAALPCMADTIFARGRSLTAS